MAKIQIKRGVQTEVNSLALATGEMAVALDTGNLYIGVEAGKKHINPAPYVHPTTHASTMITGLGNAAAKSTGTTANDVATGNHTHTAAAIGAAAAAHTHGLATATVDGFMDNVDKSKLDGIAKNANNYVHPSSHTAGMITGLSAVATSGAYGSLSGVPGVATATIDGMMAKSDKAKLDGVAEGANMYNHPVTHPASMIMGLPSVPAGLSTGYVQTGKKAGTTVSYKATAEGYNTTASGQASHSEGNETVANGTNAHAEGVYSVARLSNSHAEGYGSLSVSDGKYYKVTDASAYTSNQITLEKVTGLAIGNIVYLIMGAEVNVIRPVLCTISQIDSATNIVTIAADVVLQKSIISLTKPGASYSNIASHAEGMATIACGKYTHAEGSSTVAFGDNAHAEGWRTLASGIISHAEGAETIASEINTHAEGSHTTASGSTSHSEGSHTTASGSTSHAEGYETVSSGFAAHSEGSNTVASGKYAHAGGEDTYATADCSTIVGKHGTTNDDTLFAVANGAHISDHKLAFEIKVDGRMFVGGKEVALQFKP